MITSSKNIGFMMLAVVVVGTGTFAFADDLVATSTTPMNDGPGVYGHLQAKLLDENGNVKKYIQGDNIIVDNGLDMMIINTLAPNGGFTGGISTALGQVTHMQLGSGTSEATVTTTNTITAITNCNPDTVTGTASGASSGSSSATLSASFTTTGDGTGCATTIGEAGLFDGATGSGTDDMFAQNAFASAVTLTSNDQLDVDWTFTFADN